MRWSPGPALSPSFLPMRGPQAPNRSVPKGCCEDEAALDVKALEKEARAHIVAAVSSASGASTGKFLTQHCSPGPRGQADVTRAQPGQLEWSARPTVAPFGPRIRVWLPPGQGRGRRPGRGNFRQHTSQSFQRLSEMPLRNERPRGAPLAPSEGRATLDHGVESLSPTLGIKVT